MKLRRKNMNERLILLPLQIIEQEDGIIIKRGLEQILIPNSNALLIMQVIQRALLKQPLSRESLLSLFAAPLRPLIADLVEHLLKKRFMLQERDGKVLHQSHLENAQDVFYWHFNQYQQNIADTLNQKNWLFIGVNHLNQQLLQAMLDEGLENYIIVDDPMLRNIENFNDDHQINSIFWKSHADRIVDEDEVIHCNTVNRKDLGFVVAASEFGSFYLLERWNEYAVQNDLGFYPVVLQNMVGYAGPLVIPHESACFTCLKSRQNSHKSNFSECRLTEKHAFGGQKVVAYHQSMLKILAAVAQFDLVKFKSNIQWEVGTLCEIDLLNGNMTRRKLLKSPRCPVCSGLRNQPLVNIHKQLTSNQAWDEIRQTVGAYEN